MSGKKRRRRPPAPPPDPVEVDVADAPPEPRRPFGSALLGGGGGSVMPPIGFQAAAGAPPVPSASQPFQGKSLSFTVRMKIGECRPSIAS